ncbi:hypothetical protein MMC28_006535 [Mycoblastus sanguinarius]|nr:hypothetical protein [Mycoblastus sanguinarius]
MLFKASRPAPHLRPLTNRVDIAFYLARESAKRSWLAGHAHHVTRVRKRKLLLFLTFPLNLLNVLAFLSNIGVQCLTIRSAEGLSAQKAFNDPEHASEILITTILVSGASLNLHHACANIVFIDVPNSANAMLQALHRVFRLGQSVRLGGRPDAIVRRR